MDTDKKRKQHEHFCRCHLKKTKILPSRFPFEQTVEVLVGPEEVNFVLHKDVACKRSNFFATAYSEQWSEPYRLAKLPEHSPETFSVYMNCIYTGSRSDSKASSSLEDASDGSREDSASDDRMTSLIHLYILADKLGDLNTGNTTIDEMETIFDPQEYGPTPEVVNLGCTSTPRNSPLRRLMRDCYVHGFDGSTVKREGKGDVPGEFLLEVIEEYWRILDARMPGAMVDDTIGMEVFDEKDKCEQYHQQDTSCPRGSCRRRQRAKRGNEETE